MGSTLSVSNLRGLTSGASANTITVDSGHTLDITGTFGISGSLSGTIPTYRNAVVSSATAITVATSTPTAVCSVSITVRDNAKVLLTSAGDGNPNQTGGWHYYQFYRNGSAIGKRYINENAGGASKNCPWSITYMDQPGNGTYTYEVRVWQGSGGFLFGEGGDIQAPTIVAMEIA